jgi:hypothetical protein
VVFFLPACTYIERLEKQNLDLCRTIPDLYKVPLLLHTAMFPRLIGMILANPLKHRRLLAVGLFPFGSHVLSLANQLCCLSLP